MPDVTVGQCLFELLYTDVSDLSAADVQRLEPGQSFQVHQSGVADHGVAEV